MSRLAIRGAVPAVLQRGRDNCLSSAEIEGGAADFAVGHTLQGENAIALLYDRYSSIVYSVALRVLADTGAAEDVLQEVFMQLWRNPGLFDSSRGNLGAWLAVIARNRAIDILRKRHPETDITDVVVSVEPDMAGNAQRTRDAEKVRGALGAMPPAQRSAVEMATSKGSPIPRLQPRQASRWVRSKLGFALDCWLCARLLTHERTRTIRRGSRALRPGWVAGGGASQAGEAFGGVFRMPPRVGRTPRGHGADGAFDDRSDSATAGAATLAGCRCARTARGCGSDTAFLVGAITLAGSRGQRPSGRLVLAAERSAGAACSRVGEKVLAGQQAQLQHAREVVETLTATNAMRVTLVVTKTKLQPQGKAIYVRDRASLIFLASNLPALPPTKAYELRLVPTSGAPIPAGVFKPDAQGSAIVINPPLPAGVEAKTFAITVEREQGSLCPRRES